jgi:hypothetical protein
MPFSRIFYFDACGLRKLLCSTCVYSTKSEEFRPTKVSGLIVSGVVLTFGLSGVNASAAQKLPDIYLPVRKGLRF